MSLGLRSRARSRAQPWRRPLAVRSDMSARSNSAQCSGPCQEPQGSVYYLTIRRALGFKLADHEWMLADFASYLEQAGASTITTELALAWATRTRGSESWKAARLSRTPTRARLRPLITPAAQTPTRATSAWTPCPDLRARERLPGLFVPMFLTGRTARTSIGALGLRAGDERHGELLDELGRGADELAPDDRRRRRCADRAR